MNIFIARSPAPAFCCGISNDKKILNKGVEVELESVYCQSSGLYLMIEEEIGDFVVLGCGPATW